MRNTDKELHGFFKDDGTPVCTEFKKEKQTIGEGSLIKESGEKVGEKAGEKITKNQFKIIEAIKKRSVCISENSF